MVWIPLPYNEVDIELKRDIIFLCNKTIIAKPKEIVTCPICNTKFIKSRTASHLFCSRGDKDKCKDIFFFYVFEANHNNKKEFIDLMIRTEDDIANVMNVFDFEEAAVELLGKETLEKYIELCREPRIKMESSLFECNKKYIDLHDKNILSCKETNAKWKDFLKNKKDIEKQYNNDNEIIRSLYKVECAKIFVRLYKPIDIEKTPIQ